jgi:hypothetical protein
MTGGSRRSRSVLTAWELFHMLIVIAGVRRSSPFFDIVNRKSVAPLICVGSNVDPV